MVVTVRPLRQSDIPILKSWAAASDFEYPDPEDPCIEAFLVVADDSDKPILAAAGSRLVQIFAWLNPEAGAELRMDALSAIHEPLGNALKQLGYDSTETFLDPRLERRGFGKVLRDRFGWYRNWPSWGKKL